MSEEERAPVLRVVRGDPTPEELAAVVAVVGARQASDTAESAATTTSARSGWSAYWRSMRAPVRPGPGGWRESSLPR